MVIVLLKFSLFLTALNIDIVEALIALVLGMCRIPDGRYLRYRYLPVLRVLIPIFRKQQQSTERGRRQHKQRLCVLIIVPDWYKCPGTSDLNTNTATSRGYAHGRLALKYRYRPVFVTINNGTGIYCLRLLWTPSNE